MEKLKYVSPEYQAQLERLAETLCTPERFSGQLALFGAELLNPQEALPETPPKAA